MKILQIVHSFPPYTMAGTEVYTRNLCRELQKRHKVFVFFRINDPKKEEYEIIHDNINGIETYAINNTFRRCNSFEDTYNNNAITEKVAHLLDKIQPDLIHIQHLLFLSISMIKEAKKRKIPIIFTLNDYWLVCHMGQLLKKDTKVCDRPVESTCSECLISQLSIRKGSMFFYQFLRNKISTGLLQFLKNIYLFYAGKTFMNKDEQLIQIRRRIEQVKEISRLVDIFIAPSNFIKEKFVEFGFPEERIRYLPYGFEVERFRHIEKTKSLRIRFGYIGVLLPPKGVDILIRVFNDINPSEAELKIFGQLYPYAGYETFPAYLKNITRNKNIKFMGRFENIDISRILSEIDILIVPSIWQENSPLVIHESFLSKTPVVASNIGGIPELVRSGINGILFKPGDIKDLQEKMEYVIHNRAVLDRFKENMPKIKTIEENSKELEIIYENLAGRLEHCISQ